MPVAANRRQPGDAVGFDEVQNLAALGAIGGPVDCGQHPVAPAGPLAEFLRQVLHIETGIQRSHAVSPDLPRGAGRAQALQEGKHVAMLVDQYLTGGVEVTFFGRKTRANPMLARLLRQVECPINGVRVILIDFWQHGPKYQRQMLWVVLGIWIAVFIAALGVLGMHMAEQFL